jgi:response regulator RpfG family c-di-GMP phosphodiesterase
LLDAQVHLIIKSSGIVEEMVMKSSFSRFIFTLILVTLIGTGLFLALWWQLTHSGFWGAVLDSKYFWPGTILISVTFLVLFVVLFFLIKIRENFLRQDLTQERQIVDAFLLELAKQAEFRNQDDHRHLERTALYVQCLVKNLSEKPEWKTVLTPDFQKELVRASVLHDVGKFFISDDILLKAGPLTQEELHAVQQHAERGELFLRKIEDHLTFPSFLRMARSIAVSHHEKWDGTGYPFHLEGDEIPIEGRILGLVDVYDALRRKKVYKDAVSHDECLKVIFLLSGSQFDPDVVEGFLSCQEEFHRLSETVN